MEDYLIQGIKNHMHDMGGFDKCRVIDVRPGYCLVEVEALEEMGNVYMQVHGGVLMALIDLVSTTAAYATGKHVITLSSNTNFIKGFAADGKTMRIESETVHNGSRTMVVETTIYNDQGKACVRNSSTMFVSKKVEESDPIPTAPGKVCEFIADEEYLRSVEL